MRTGNEQAKADRWYVRGFRYRVILTSDPRPKNNDKNLSVLFSNVRSVTNKRDALFSLFDDCAADIVGKLGIVLLR